MRKISFSHDNPSLALEKAVVETISHGIISFCKDHCNQKLLSKAQLQPLFDLLALLSDAAIVHESLTNLTRSLTKVELEIFADNLLIYQSTIKSIKTKTNTKTKVYRWPYELIYCNNFSKGCDTLHSKIKNIAATEYISKQEKKTIKEANAYLREKTKTIVECNAETQYPDNFPRNLALFPSILAKIYLETKASSRHIENFDEGLKITFIIYSYYSYYKAKCEQLPNPPNIKITAHLEKFKLIVTDALSFCTNENIIQPTAKKLITRLWLFALIFHEIEKNGPFVVNSEWSTRDQQIEHSIFSAYLNLFMTNFGYEFQDVVNQVGPQRQKRNIIEAPLIFWRNVDYYYGRVAPEPENLPKAPSDTGGNIPIDINAFGATYGEDRLRQLLQSAFDDFGWNFLYPSKNTTVMTNGAAVLYPAKSYDSLDLTFDQFAQVRNLIRIGRRSTSEYQIHNEWFDKSAHTYYCQPIYDFINEPLVQICRPKKKIDGS